MSADCYSLCVLLTSTLSLHKLQQKIAFAMGGGRGCTKKSEDEEKNKLSLIRSDWPTIIKHQISDVVFNYNSHG